MPYIKIYDEGTNFQSKRHFKDKECTIYHREDGPAIEFSSSRHFYWFINGKLHREDGPAVIKYYGSDVRFYIEGKLLSEEDYMIEINKRKRFGGFV